MAGTVSKNQLQHKVYFLNVNVAELGNRNVCESKKSFKTHKIFKLF